MEVLAPARRRGLIAVSAGAALLCVAVVVAILLIVRNRPAGQEAATTSPHPIAPQVPVTTTITPTPSPAASSPPAPLSPSVVTTTPAKPAGSPGQALQDYYTLIPGNLAAGFARLTDRFKAAHKQTMEKYISWWGRFKSVTASNVNASGDTVTADITYVDKSGKTSHEHNTFTLIQQNGVWLIDAQS